MGLEGYRLNALLACFVILIRDSSQSNSSSSQTQQSQPMAAVISFQQNRAAQILASCVQGGHHVNFDLTFNQSALDPENTECDQLLPLGQIVGAGGTNQWTMINSPAFTDPIQASYGDCFLVSSVAAILVDHAHLLSQIILTDYISEYGIVQVLGCSDGLWTPIIIGDLFPCNSSNRMLCSQAQRNQLFMPVIEKYFALECGGFDMLNDGGEAYSAMAKMTGMPIQNLLLSWRHSNRDGSWNALIQFRQSRYPMVLGSHSDISDNDDDNVVNHAYTIIDVIDASGLRLLKVRDPGGVTQYNGNFSFNSPSWNDYPGLKAHLGYSRNLNNLGIFFLPFDDLMDKAENQETKISVCKVHNDWQEMRFPGYFFPSPNAKVTMFQVLTDDAAAELSLFIANNRLSDTEVTDGLVFVLNAAALANPNSSAGVISNLYWHSNKLMCPMTSWSCPLHRGTYAIVCASTFEFKPNAAEADIDDFSRTLVIHTLAQARAQERSQPPFLLTDCLIAMALKIGQTRQVTNG